MSGVGAQSFTFQLSSKTAEKTGGNVEQYRLALTPSVQVPFTAQPTAELLQLAFTNTVTNVDARLYNNNKIVFKWSPFVANQSTQGGTITRKDKTYTMTVPDGTYSLQDLEEFIARELYQKTNVRGGNFNQLNRVVEPSSGLFWDMDLLAGAPPCVSDAQNTFKCGKAVTANAGYGIELLTIPGQHFVGGVLETSTPGTWRILWITTYGHESIDADTSKCTVYVSSKIPDAFAKGDDVVLRPPADTDGIDDQVDHLGFGALGIANPSLAPTSGWGTAFNMDELQLIAHTPGADANTIAPDRAHATFAADNTLIELEQNQRRIKPVTFSVDPITHRIHAVVGVPLVKIDASSTLFTDLLGFTSYDNQNMLQLPADEYSQQPQTLLSPWLADNISQITRAKAVEFHCPTLVNSSYDQHGRCNGGSLASVPITTQRGEVEVWQASFDTSVPISYHGGAIDSLTWSLCDQDGQPINLQGTDFNATIRISWPDPMPPQIGSAGAEAEDAYGLRDVKYVG